MVLLPIAASTGAEFTSLTVMVMVSEALAAGEPLSVTRMVTRFVLGPWVSLGVHAKTPEAGLIVVPAGAPASRLKVRVCTGRSESVARARKVKRAASLTVLLPMGERTGALFTSLTVMITAWAALRAGEPLSVTRTVTLLVFGPCASVGVQVKTPVV